MQLFAYPFRIFFLSLGVLALLVVPLWAFMASGQLVMPTALPGVFWHQHEMLFGFLSAAIAGFLLTAVCVWTNTERLHGRILLWLWLVWLAGRLLLALGETMPFWLVQGINLAFLPLIMIDAGWRIWKAKQPKQWLILLVLGILWAMQIAFVVTLDHHYIEAGLIAALALSSIIGGRITPAFTAGWLKQRGGDAQAVRVLPRLDFAVLINMICLVLLMVADWSVGVAVLALSAAVLMLIRLYGWHGWLTSREPLLWILHISLLWVPLSLLLLVGHAVFGWSDSAWIHAAGIGVVGSLVLGVIARVSLGHTGRTMVLPTGMVTAFFAIQLATLVRVATALELVPWAGGIMLTGLLWEVAFLIFLLRYAVVLGAPRIDGRPG
ncbi:NnrS family protein [Allohahella marinimesophila]|uniref:NnrS family protein n=1 Tax=Allohahella marinimesophila TaxID=1054972 RepID=A0ABP7Q7M0_9GAMM